MTASGKNRIMIFGPKDDGTYVVEFRTGEVRRWRSRFLETEARVLTLSGANAPS
jgi:hypothetical protein